MTAWVRRLSPRAEKTLRLAATCLLAAIVGTLAVVLDNEPLGYVAAAIILVGILAGPVVARALSGRGGGDS
jgi:hypothetical protein